MTLAIALPLMSLLSQSPIPYEQSAREQIACAPISLPARPTAGLRVIGGSVPGRYLFGPGDAVIVNAGTAQGLQKGQQYFVRRYVKDQFTPMYTDFSPHSVHTAGWVTIVDAKNDLSVATVTHACDGIIEGDYLEPFVDPVFPPAALPGAPDLDHPGRIVMGDEKRQIGAANSLMLINRGTDHDVRAGQTVTIFRETMGGKGPLLEVGQGTVLSVRPQTSLIRVEATREAVYLGDLVAIHRITQ
jgi:hypothetical protein